MSFLFFFSPFLPVFSLLPSVCFRSSFPSSLGVVKTAMILGLIAMKASKPFISVYSVLDMDRLLRVSEIRKERNQNKKRSEKAEPRRITPFLARKTTSLIFIIIFSFLLFGGFSLSLPLFFVFPFVYLFV